MFTYPWGVDEDALTGDFFGLMKYLPATALLVPFLDFVQDHYKDRKIMPRYPEEGEVLLWPSYEIPLEWREEFNMPNLAIEKRRSKSYIVPDVVLQFDDCIFVVEAEKSHSVEAEQLFQQYLVGRRKFLTGAGTNRRLFNLLINTDQLPPYACHISANDSKTGTAILHSDSVPLYMQKRARMLGEPCDLREIERSFLWISWHHIGRFSEELTGAMQGQEDMESRILTGLFSGLKEMMDGQGYYPVRIFQADDPEEISLTGYPAENIPMLRIIPLFNPQEVSLASSPAENIPMLRTIPLFNPQEFLNAITPTSIHNLMIEGSSLRYDFNNFELAINPMAIPAFQLYGNLTKWLSGVHVNPEAINVLRNGGNHGDERSN